MRKSAWLGPSSQAATMPRAHSARRAASQTDRGTAAVSLVAVSHSYSYLLVVTARDSRHSTSKHDARWTRVTPRASRVSNNHCALPGSYPSPCRAVPRPRRRRHPPDLDKYLYPGHAALAGVVVSLSVIELTTECVVCLCVCVSCVSCAPAPRRRPTPARPCPRIRPLFGVRSRG